MGTYTEVFALPCAPSLARRVTMRAPVANFGLNRVPKAQYDRSDPQRVLGRIVFGFSEDVDEPWVTFEPREVSVVRREILRAIEVNAATKDDLADWWESQLKQADRVFAHAEKHREWVVSVFEGSSSCFLHGGTARFEEGDQVFGPHCKPPLVPKSRSPVIPLGIMGALTIGLAIAGWRQRRFLERLAGGTRNA